MFGLLDYLVFSLRVCFEFRLLIVCCIGFIVVFLWFGFGFCFGFGLFVCFYLLTFVCELLCSFCFGVIICLGVLL